MPNVAGTWKDLTYSVNGMANNLTSQVRNIAQETTAVAQSDLSTKIDVDARGEILALKTTINTMVDQLSSFADEVTRVAREVDSEGRLGGHAEVAAVSGTWKRLTEHVNELAGNLTRQVRAIAEVTSAVATGDLTRSITVEAQGEVAELKDNINAMVQSLRQSTKANQEQEWLQTNLARIAPLLQGQRDLKNAQIEQARQEIEERASQLDLASRYKSQFLANMSHELRTPLNSLLVLARLLAQNPDRNLTPKQVEYATVIHSSGSELLQLINDILDLSKVEARKMEVHPESFPVLSLVDDLDAVVMPLMAEKGLAFAIDPDPDVPSVLYTDKQCLRQILHNLVSNAFKFTDNGSVIVRVALACRHPTHGRLTLEFSVTDTGIGIADENLNVIFGAFAQGETSTGSSYGGTGLGLAICREVAAALGGRITVRSNPGQGSTFSLYLPVADTDREKSIAAGASDYITKPIDTETLLARLENWLTTPDQALA